MTIIKAVKLTSLFAQYLYTHHRLDLPGMGTFLLDPSAITMLENSKQRSAVTDGISFENNPSLKESPDFITFISAQTGKMKALAVADLESHLQLVHQFLNLGKPFVFEGIGTLLKKKPGQLEFLPLSVSAEKIKEYKTKEAEPVAADRASEEYEPFLDAPEKKGGWKKPVFALVILVIAGLAFWGAYIVSNSGKPVEAETLENAVAAPGTEPDTFAVKKEPVREQSYKYILETAGAERAFKRYSQLKTFQWDVQLETSDSITYKLFLRLPANADTTRILDSLTVMSGKKVYIEHQNQ